MLPETGLPAVAADQVLSGLPGTLAHHIGLFAVLILLCSVLDRAIDGLPRPLRQFLLGLVFGGGAVGAMLDPIVMAPGVMIDARSVMIALSGTFGGSIAALTATALGCAYRLWIGGSGAVPACASMAAVAACGVLLAGLRLASRRPMRLSDLVLLAAATNGVTTVAIVFLTPEAVMSWRGWAAFLVMHAAGILVLGFALREQRLDRCLRRELETALDGQSQLAERHQVITNNVADGIVTLDEAGVIRSFNSSAEWIFGSVAGDIVGQNVSVLMPDLAPGQGDTAIHRYLKTGKATVIGADGTMTGRRRNGSTFPMELRIAEFSLNGARFFTASVRDLTKARAAEERRAQAEAMLRISETRFRDCAKASSDYLWESDAEHRFTSWAGGAQAAAFYQATIIGRTRWEVAEADPAEEPWAHHLECLNARRPFRNFIFSMVAGDGTARWIRSSGVPFLDAAGRFGGYRGASSDITHVIEAEHALQARASQQEALAVLSQLALQDGCPDRLFATAFDVLARTLDVRMAGVFDKSGDGDLVLSAGIGWDERDLGNVRLPCSPSSLPGQAFLSGETVIHRTAVMDGGAESRRFAERYGIVSGMAAGLGDISRRSGSLLVCTSRARGFDREEAGFFQALAFILGAAIERRRAEVSLVLRDRALESIGQGLVISDATVPEAPAVYVNAAFERARGAEPGALIGRGLTALFASEDDPAIGARIGRDLREKGHHAGRLRTRRGGGRETWEDVSIKPLCDERGTLTHYVAVQTDVTQRVDMEAELLQAHKMDAVGKLTGGVAHDFNNLLTVILGNAELLVDDLSDPQAKHTAEMVLDAAERGSDLVQRLLAFGRRQALQPEYLDLDAAVTGLAALLRRTIGEDIVLRTDLNGGGRTTFIDKSHLETAILNLVANARDAMKGGGTLTIATKPVEVGPDQGGLERKPGRYVSLVVADTGSGMSPDVKERVFEPFFTTKEIGKGTGLGLSTVYGFVQQSGGHVQIETELGRGTRVMMFLPASEGPVQRPSDPAVPALRVGGERVLLVEDQDDVRSFVTAQLLSFGYDVVAAATAPAAIEILRRDPDVRLLFTDILLPAGPDGMELAECALESRPDLKVLFTSGYSDYAAERRSRLLDRGVPLLKKPYRRIELASALREALDRPSRH